MEWFNSLPLLEQIFFFIALPATAILIVQMILLIVGGIGGGGMDLDSDTSGMDLDAADDFDLDVDIGDIAEDGGDGSESLEVSDLRFVTTRGIIAFLAIAGWTGICCMEYGTPSPATILISLAAGAAAMVGIAFLVRALLRLQSVNSLDYRRALGQTGEVYLTIPPNNTGAGKVSLVLSGALKQYDAVTNWEQRIPTGEMVRVVDIVRDDVMVVEPENR